MRITVKCPKCGHKWTVTKAELLAGGWDECPRCGEKEEEDDDED